MYTEWPVAFGLFMLFGHHWRSNTEKQMYRGLLDRVQSPEFLCDLGLMYDTLLELSVLSQELQAPSITLLKA